MIDEFLAAPERFELADSADVYPRLRLFPDDEIAHWHEARRNAIAAAPGLVAVADERGLAAFATIRNLPSDTEAFGVPIGAIDVVGVRNDAVEGRLASVDRLAASIRDRHEEWGSLLTMLVDLDRSAVTEGLQTAGAQVAGGNLTWTCRLDQLDPELLAAPARLREEEYAGDEDELLAAVAAAYATYRSHYHADSRLAGADGSAPYVASIGRLVRNGGEVALLRGASGAIAGFSTLDPHAPFNEAVGRRAVAEIGTSGVVPDARESGVYESSLLQGLRRFVADGYETVVFGCTADNFAVQSTWIRIGRFRPRRFCFRLHWWPAG